MRGLEPLFQDEKEKADAPDHLKALLEMPGWKLITRALQLNADFHAQQLRDRTDFESVNEVYQLQEKIDHLETLQNLPAILITEALGQPTTEDDHDVY